MSLAQSTKKHDAGRIPGPAAVPNVVEIKAQIVLPNTKLTFFTVQGFNSGSTTVNQSLANTLFASISSAWGSNLGTYMHTSTQFQFVYVRDMTNPNLPVFQSVGSAVAGSGAGVPMPEQDAIVLTENVAQRGRGVKGRVYLGGWVQSADVTPGAISGTVQTAVNTFGTALFNAISAASLAPCLAQVARNAYIGYSGTSHPQRTATHVLITNYVCRDTIWDTQRRRAQL
jgi:hypothetical protein